MIGFQKSVATIRWRYKQKSTTLLFDASFLHFLSNDRSGSKEALIYFCGLLPQSGVWYFSCAPPRKSESDSFQHSDFRRSRNERTQYIHKFFPKMVDYLKKALIYGHTRRISSEIYYQFTTFEGKSFDMPPGTLQAQYQHTALKN